MRKVFCLVVGAAMCLSLTPEVQAAVITTPLLDHGGGSKGPNYGLRVDNGGVQTFSFAPGVLMNFFTAGNTAQITGTVQHNQTGQLWAIMADLSMHLFTHDGTEWRTNVSGDFYPNMIEDMINNADNVFGDGAGNLKEYSFPADRIGFEVGVLTMTYQGLPADAIFSLPGNPAGMVTLYDYPQGADQIPFLLAKGHRLSAVSNELVGIGWLDPRAPGDQTGSDGLVQDWLFRVGPPAPIPEPGTLLLIGSGLVGVGIGGRRRNGRK